MKILELLDALRPSTGKSQARRREKEVNKRMGDMLKEDLPTFKKSLAELGINEGDEEYELALKIYDATS